MQLLCASGESKALPLSAGKSFWETSNGFSRDFIMILFGEGRSPGCLREEGEREMASRIAWWGTGASIFRPVKNWQSPGLGTQLQMFKLWMKEEKWGQMLDLWSALYQMLWDWKKGLLVWLSSGSWDCYTFLWDLLSPLWCSSPLAMTQGLSACSSVFTQILAPLLTNWVAVAKSLNLCSLVPRLHPQRPWFRNLHVHQAHQAEVLELSFPMNPC